MHTLQTCLAQGVIDPPALAHACGRTTPQVKAYLRNQQVKAHVTAGLHLPQVVVDDTNKRGRKPVTTAMHTNPHAVCNARQLLLQGTRVLVDSNNDNTSDGEEEDAA
jgi:hypothetical protein